MQRQTPYATDRNTGGRLAVHDGWMIARRDPIFGRYSLANLAPFTWMGLLRAYLSVDRKNKKTKAITMGDYGAYVMCLKLQLENLMLRLFTCVYMHGKYADEFYKWYNVMKVILNDQVRDSSL